MEAKMACIGDEHVHARLSSDAAGRTEVGVRRTPFGPSDEIVLLDGQHPVYALSPTGSAPKKVPHHKINSRANLYALKDLGVECVLACEGGLAIRHDLAIGDIVVLADLIDMTYLPGKTFFRDLRLAPLRQFPVFCERLARAATEAMDAMDMHYLHQAVAAVCGDLRLRTPAEVRVLAASGAEIITHAFVPEVFLARELQLCYAGFCYISSYAETGSRYRPFAGGGLFGAAAGESDSDRLAHGLRSAARIIRSVSAAASGPRDCECGRTMAENIEALALPADWREWF